MPLQLDRNDEDAREFEESLIKLASLAKHKIKISDLTEKDRFNVMDLFVNNEKTLIKIYEALFPHRIQNNANGVLNTKVKTVKGDIKYMDGSISFSSKNIDLIQPLDENNMSVDQSMIND